MGATTGIEWCDRTWSPWIGCTKISPACDGCYAAHLMDTRLGRVEWGPHGERSRTSASYWRQLERWNREAKAAGITISVFPSLCDPWDNAADPSIRRDWFALMRETPNLLHLLLSKRPQNAVSMAEAAGGLPDNAALGATVEDQKRADVNVPHLLLAKRRLGARIAFLSCEPLLERIELEMIWLRREGERGTELSRHLGDYVQPLRGNFTDSPRIDWIITGGETDQGSHKARPTHPDWFRSIRDQCAAAGVPYLHKQNGEWLPAGDWYEHHPVSLVLREFRDGQWQEVQAGAREHGEYVARIGKKAAGRLLDGVEHNGMPSLPAPSLSREEAGTR